MPAVICCLNDPDLASAAPPAGFSVCHASLSAFLLCLKFFLFFLHHELSELMLHFLLIQRWDRLFLLCEENVILETEMWVQGVLTAARPPRTAPGVLARVC